MLVPLTWAIVAGKDSTAPTAHTLVAAWWNLALKMLSASSIMRRQAASLASDAPPQTASTKRSLRNSGAKVAPSSKSSAYRLDGTMFASPAWPWSRRSSRRSNLRRDVAAQSAMLSRDCGRP